MKQSDIQIIFQGFQPTDTAHQLFQHSLEEIYEEAPYGAVLKANITFHDGAFKGILSINSAAGPFFAVASDTNLRNLSDRLIVQIKRQLERWKNTRFDRSEMKHFENSKGASHDESVA